MLRQRLARRQAHRFAHRTFGPLRIALAHQCQRADVGDGVADALGLQRVARRACSRRAGAAVTARRGLRAGARRRHADRHRRGRAERGGRSHRGDVAGVQDVGACAGCARTLRRHECGHRHRRGEDVPDDGAHRGVEAAGCVEPQHHQCGTSLLRTPQAPLHVVGSRRPDGAVDLQQRDRRRTGRRGGRCRRVLRASQRSGTQSQRAHQVARVAHARIVRRTRSVCARRPRLGFARWAARSARRRSSACRSRARRWRRSSSMRRW